MINHMLCDSASTVELLIATDLVSGKCQPPTESTPLK